MWLIFFNLRIYLAMPQCRRSLCIQVLKQTTHFISYMELKYLDTFIKSFFPTKKKKKREQNLNNTKIHTPHVGLRKKVNREFLP